MTAEPVTLPGGWAGFHALVGSDAVANNTTTDLIRILDTVEVPIVVVQHDFVIAGFNNAAAEVLGFSAVDVGRASSDIQTFAGMTRLEQECVKVLASGVESQVDVRYDEKWFVVRIPQTGETTVR